MMWKCCNDFEFYLSFAPKCELIESLKRGAVTKSQFKEGESGYK